jgi:hypothetical protein
MDLVLVFAGIKPAAVYGGGFLSSPENPPAVRAGLPVVRGI